MYCCRFFLAFPLVCKNVLAKPIGKNEIVKVTELDTQKKEKEKNLEKHSKTMRKRKVPKC